MNAKSNKTNDLNLNFDNEDMLSELLKEQNEISKGCWDTTLEFEKEVEANKRPSVFFSLFKKNENSSNR